MLEVTAFLMPCNQLVLIFSKLAFDYFLYKINGDIHIVAFLFRADDIAFDRNRHLNLLTPFLYAQCHMNLRVRGEIPL